MTQNEAHKKALNLIQSKLYTQGEIAVIMKITRQTINSRVKYGDWRKKEVDIIETLGQ